MKKMENEYSASLWVLKEAKRLLDFAIAEFDPECDSTKMFVKSAGDFIRVGCECDDYNGFDCGCTHRSFMAAEANRELNNGY